MSAEWKRKNPEKWKEYNRTYHRERYRKLHPGRHPEKVKPIIVTEPAEVYKSLTEEEIAEELCKKMSWNPRICEHGPHYDCPYALDRLGGQG